MDYYILLEGDTETDVLLDNNLLGTESFGVFYPGQGFVAFHKIVNARPDLLDTLTIKTDMNKTLSVTEFMDLFVKFKIKNVDVCI
jgi:hypothetical protein